MGGKGGQCDIADIILRVLINLRYMVLVAYTTQTARCGHGHRLLKAATAVQIIKSNLESRFGVRMGRKLSLITPSDYCSSVYTSLH